MCGICFILSPKSIENQINPGTLELLRNRGPDFCRIENITTNNGLQLTLCGCVLSIRGDKVSQPISHSSFTILFNGEIYDGLQIVDEFQNDVELLLESIIKEKCYTSAKLLQRFESLNGEWAFILYDNLQNKIWFGRDPIGRKSLLVNIDLLSNSGTMNLDTFTISSVVHSNHKSEHGWFEVPSGSIYEINLNSVKTTQNKLSIHSEKYDYARIKEIYSVICDRPYLPAENEPIEVHENYVIKFADLLSQAVKLRVAECTFPVEVREHYRSIALLFSGGIDCTILAAIAHKYLPSSFCIELWNLTFYADEKYPNPHESPDRQSGINSFKELHRLYPSRNWKFLQIDIHIDDLIKYRSERIKNLINPSKNVLDESIGCSLWFAASGLGNLLQFPNSDEISDTDLVVQQNYVSKCKILLSGQGADEFFGGYSRYGTAFRDGGWEAMRNEMYKDILRLHSRNLGRDDRCISDHGREVRLPFLDENILKFSSTLPLEFKRDPRIARNENPDKRVIREALKRMGFSQSIWQQKKTAIQFGSRIAKLENSKSKANDVSSNL